MTSRCRPLTFCRNCSTFSPCFASETGRESDLDLLLSSPLDAAPFSTGSAGMMTALLSGTSPPALTLWVFKRTLGMDLEPAPAAGFCVLVGWAGGGGVTALSLYHSGYLSCSVVGRLLFIEGASPTPNMASSSPGMLRFSTGGRCEVAPLAG